MAKHSAVPRLLAACILAGCEQKLTPVPFTRKTVEISEVGRAALYYAYRKPSEEGAYPDPPRSVCVSGQRMLVAAGPGGLALFDLSKEDIAPSWLGQFVTDPFTYADGGERGDATHFLVDGNRAFVAVNGGYWAWGGRTMVVVLDVSNPAAPRKLGERLLPGKGGWGDRGILVRGMAVEKNHLAIAAGSFGGNALAEVWDVSQPSRIRRMAGFNAPGVEAGDVILRGGLVYFAVKGPGKGGVENGVIVYRLSDLAEGKPPVEKFACPTPARKLQLLSSVLLAACDDLGLNFIDVSRPGEGKAIPAPEAAGPSIRGEVMGLSATEKHAWVLSRFTEGAGVKTFLNLFEISNPARPQALGTTETPGVMGIGPGLEDSVCLAYADGRVTVLRANGLHEERPLLPCGQLCEGLAKSGDFLYVACGRGGVMVFDVADPSSPKLIGHSPTRGYARKVCLEGDTLFVAELGDGLTAVSVSDPKNPMVIGSWHQGVGVVQDVFVLGNYAYLASDNFGLEVLAIDNPTQPALASSLKLEDDRCANDSLVDRCNPRGIRVQSGFAYLANGRAGLAVIDVSNPRNPRMVSRLYDEKTRRMNLWDVEQAGDRLLLVDHDGGLYVADASEPGLPRILSRFHTGQGNAAAAEGDAVFVADGGYGIKALDIAQPARPRYLGGQYLNEENFNDIVVEHGCLYAAGSTGLRILRFRHSETEVRTAFAFGEKVKRLPIDESGLKLGASATFYGRNLTVLDNGVDVCASSYEGHDSWNGPLRPVVADLSDKSGWPRTPVEQGTLAIDPHSGRIKFPDGDDDSMRIVGHCWLGMGIPNQGLLRGDFFYDSNDEGLNVVIADVSDPSRPKLASVLATQGFAHGISVDGNLLAASNVVHGSTFFDISDPYHPRPVGFLKGQEYLREIRLVDGGRKFFSRNPKTGKLLLTDISDRNRPVTLGEYEFSFVQGQKHVYGTKDIEMEVARPDGSKEKRNASAFLVWNIEKPESPLELGRLVLEDLRFREVGRSEDGGLLPCIGVDPKNGYHLILVDVSAKDSPKLLSRLNLNRAASGRESLDPLYHDGCVYVGGYCLQTVDARNPASPSLLGTGSLRAGHLGCPAPGSNSPWVKGHFVLMNNALHGLDVFDVTDKSHPKNIGGLGFQGGDWLGVFARDGLAASANNWGGVYLVDVSDRTKPVLAASTRYLTDGGGQSPFITADSRLLVYQGSMMMHGSFAGLGLVDISDPVDARFIRRENCGKRDGLGRPDAKLPVGAGGYCTVLEREISVGKKLPPKKLRLAIYPQDCTVVDITNPSDSRVLGSNAEAGGVTGAVAGDHYFTMGTDFKCVDLSDPARPKVVGRCEGILTPCSYGRAIAYRAGHVYLATAHAIVVINVTNPAEPFVENTVEISGFGVDVSVLGDRLYAAGYYGSLFVFDITQPAHPRKMYHFGDGVYWDYAFVNMEHCYESMTADRGHAYVNEYATGLVIIDVPTAAEAPRGEISARVRSE
ncbi:MAG: hypothetical protein HYU36_21190 [Planctomycetes bacterium]|nr:hypothetical protein [Planctomycetota bacterium]